jgi:hypothetical protein
LKNSRRRKRGGTTAKCTPTPGKSIFHTLREDAKVRATPHWQAAEEAEKQADALAQKRKQSEAQIEELKKSLQDSLLRPKDPAKVKAQIDSQQKRCDKLKAEEQQLLATAKTERAAGDAIYWAIYNLDIKNPHAVDANHGEPEELLAAYRQLLSDIATTRDALKHELMTALESTCKVTPDLFFDNFAFLADAPNGIQKLRELILQLAVQGKVVLQDPNDEPASILFEKIQYEKERLIKEGHLGRSKALPPLKNGEGQPPLPKGWRWVRLADIGEFCGGATPSTTKSEYWGGKIPWVSPKDMKSAHITTTDLFITEKALNETRLRLLPINSLLIVGRSGILKRLLPVAINDVECTVNQDLKVLIPYLFSTAEYLRLMLKGHESLILQDLVKGGVTVQSLKYEEFERYPFPLPPEAEQHRIVAKVDQLMAFCDELEAKLKQAQTNSEKLATAMVQSLLAA